MLKRAHIALLTFIVGVSTVSISRRFQTVAPRPIVQTTAAAQQFNPPGNTHINHLVNTVGGLLEESTTLDSWRITLNGKDILVNDSSGKSLLEPQLMSHVGGFDEVIIIGAMPCIHYCCPEFSLWFLGLNADGTYYLSQEIVQDGLGEQRVEIKDNALKLVLGHEMRIGSKTSGPYDVWVLKNRKLSLLRSAPRAD